MFLSMIKEQIKKEVLEEARNQQELFYNDIMQILKLEKMSDKEIAEEYKHEKFQDVSILIRTYLCKRYDINLINSFLSYSFCFRKYTV